jgi:hypothetical protein
MRPVVHQRQAQGLAHLKAGPFTHAEQILSDGRSLLTLHPAGLPAVQGRVIESRIEPGTAERLAAFPSSQTATRADPRHLHRLVTTVLDPEHAPATERILCSQERGEIDACIDAQNHPLRVSHQPMRRKEPLFVRQERYGWLLAHSLVRWWMHHSACQADLDPDRLRFTHAGERLDTACSACALVAREELPPFQERFLAALREPASLVPARRLRCSPRVVTRASSRVHRTRPGQQGFPLTQQSFVDLLLLSRALPPSGSVATSDGMRQLFWRSERNEDAAEGQSGSWLLIHQGDAGAQRLDPGGRGVCLPR